MKLLKKYAVLGLVVVIVALGVLTVARGVQDPKDKETKNSQSSCEKYKEGGYIAEYTGPPIKSLADLVNRSDAVVVARVVDCGTNPSELSPGDYHNVTHNFTVEKTAKGALDQGRLKITMRVQAITGGTANREYRTPRIFKDDRVVLFLERIPSSDNYRLILGGSTIAFASGENEFTFSDKAELGEIQQTFTLSDLRN